MRTFKSLYGTRCLAPRLLYWLTYSIEIHTCEQIDFIIMSHKVVFLLHFHTIHRITWHRRRRRDTRGTRSSAWLVIWNFNATMVSCSLKIFRVTCIRLTYSAHVKIAVPIYTLNGSTCGLCFKDKFVKNVYSVIIIKAKFCIWWPQKCRDLYSHSTKWDPNPPC